MKKTFKILVWAYINKNLGDDLFIKILAERYPNYEINIINAKEENITPFKNYNIKTISFKKALLNINKFDAFVDIGGSIFQFRNSLWGNLKKKILLTATLKCFNKNTFVLGSNFGPYTKRGSVNITKLYFRLAKDVCMRDTQSYDIFKDLKNVRMAPDIVFSMNVNDIEKIDRNIIGISMIDIEQRDDLKEHSSVYYKRMKEISEQLLNENLELRLISFCEEEGDSQILDKLYNDLKNKGIVRKMYYSGEMENYLRELSYLGAVISCRFHSFILSQVYQQNTYPIIYSDKLTNVLKDIGLDKYYCKIKDIDNINLEDISESIYNNKIDILDISKRAEKHFENLDKELG